MKSKHTERTGWTSMNNPRKKSVNWHNVLNEETVSGMSNHTDEIPIGLISGVCDGMLSSELTMSCDPIIAATPPTSIWLLIV